MHQLHIAHRDLSLENVLVTARSPKTGIYYARTAVHDFGLACYMPCDATYVLCALCLAQ